MMVIDKNEMKDYSKTRLIVIMEEDLITDEIEIIKILEMENQTSNGDHQVDYGMIRKLIAEHLKKFWETEMTQCRLKEMEMESRHNIIPSPMMVE